MCVVSRRNHTGSLNCEYDPASLTTKPGKTQGKIGWLGADAVEVTVNLYGPLFTGCEIEVVEDGKTSIKEVSAEIVQLLEDKLLSMKDLDAASRKFFLEMQQDYGLMTEDPWFKLGSALK